MLWLDTFFGPSLEEFAQTLVLEAADHTIDCNLTRYGLQDTQHLKLAARARGVTGNTLAECARPLD